MTTITRFFDVHVWPAQGRIVMVNADPGSAYGPSGMVVTEVTIRDMTPMGGRWNDPSEAVVMAASLTMPAYDISPDSYTLIEHGTDGTMTRIHPVNFERTAL